MSFINFSFVLLFYLIFTFFNVDSVSSNEITDALCGLTTDELIVYYGYEAETHNVTTADGYILTIFRCNSKKQFPTKKKPVILQHGIIISSDDFCINPPDQSFAYFLADAGYDVWIPNSRGNFYSRGNVHLDANNPLSGYWNFSWYEMGIYDQPAQIDYILEQTQNQDCYFMAYSQGTTALMVLLSQKPEYNQKIRAASLMAPVGFNTHVDFYKMLYPVTSVLQYTIDFGVFNRYGPYYDFFNVACSLSITLCNSMLDSISGPSKNQRNNTIIPAFICHFPSGSSTKQFYHYSQEAHFEYFGKYMTSQKIPKNFDLSRITTPLSLHYTTVDALAVAADVERLIPLLKSAEYIQRIDEQFDHIDFAWGKNAASLVYSKILNFFEKYQ